MDILYRCCVGWLVMAVLVYAVLLPSFVNAPYMDEVDDDRAE